MSPFYKSLRYATLPDVLIFNKRSLTEFGMPVISQRFIAFVLNFTVGVTRLLLSSRVSLLFINLLTFKNKNFE